MRPGRPTRYTPNPARAHRIRKGKPPRRHGRPRFAALRDPAYRDWIRRQVCVITGLRHGQGWVDARGRRRIARIHPSHLRSRGAGGPDRGNLVPLLSTLHREQHRIGIRTFQAKYAIDLAAHAVRLDAVYEALPVLERAA